MMQGICLLCTRSTRRLRQSPPGPGPPWWRAVPRALPSPRHQHQVAGDPVNPVPGEPAGDGLLPASDADGSPMLKEERRRLHDERASAAADRREVNRRRRLAAELVAALRSRRAFRIVAPRGLGSGAAREEYRRFYLDSLDAYGELLWKGGDDDWSASRIGLGEDTALQVLGELEAVMDGLSVDSMDAFGEMSEVVRQSEQLKSKMDRVGKGHARQLETLQNEETRYEELRLTQQAKAEPDFAQLDTIESKLDAAAKFLGSPKSTKSATAAEIDAQLKKVNAIRSSADRLGEELKRLEDEMGELVRPMSGEDFQRASDAIESISRRLAPSLALLVSERRSECEHYREMESHTDLTRPWEWYPRARLDRRRIVFHAGPTNSGKTYNALERLKRAGRGVYLAPLRLLAAECYTELNRDGVYCSLLTGQEQRTVPFATHTSSTVELADLDEDYDVVVIDEIQMIQDEFRGYAWSRALMGMRCKEIHVCGGPEAVDLVKKIAKNCNDDFEVRRYERFTKLAVEDSSLAASPSAKGAYSNVKKGDCVVAFAKKDIFAIKREIERDTSHKCCVIYGSLPPEIRTEQARLFNDQDSDYDILVASDAIGMGLNLAIRRIILNSIYKNNGETIVKLDHSSCKQIAGRAGRRNSPFPNGVVTTRCPSDLKYLRTCMETDIEPLARAGLVPSPPHIALFSEQLTAYSGKSNMELHQVLAKFSDMATFRGGDFFLCRKKSLEIVSRWLKNYPLPTELKFSLCMSPVRETCPRSKRAFQRFVDTFSKGRSPGVHFSLIPRPAKNFNHLSDLCSIHSELELFLWLQGKVEPSGLSSAVERARATAAKDETVQMINEALAKEYLSLNHCYVAKDARVKKIYKNANPKIKADEIVRS